MNTPLAALARPHLRRATGFTLIELMITVAIVAILATIAYPSYRNYVIRGQIVNATNALAADRANLERVYQDNRSYVAPAAAPPGYTPCVAALDPPTTSGTFAVNCLALSPTGYTLQAVGIAGSSTDGFTYTVNEMGLETSTVASPAPSAWIKTCNPGWETKEGQCL